MNLVSRNAYELAAAPRRRSLRASSCLACLLRAGARYWVYRVERAHTDVTPCRAVCIWRARALARRSDPSVNTGSNS